MEEDDRIIISWRTDWNVSKEPDPGIGGMVTDRINDSKILMDGSSRIMDGTPEVDELRRLCRKQTEGVYPP